jgi:Kef-type K+ transport system membrane component KefB
VIPILVLVAIGGLMHTAGTFSGSAATSGTLLAFGYLLLVAYFAGRLVSRIGLPRLVGYLLAGVISGPFVLELVTTAMTGKLRIVNSVATCILGLVAGAELNLERVRPIMRTIRAAMVFAVIGGMFVLAGALFAMRPLLPIFDGVPVFESLAICAVVGVALIPQSPAIVLAMLAETNSDGKLSQLFLAMVVVADLVVVILYSIVAAAGSAILGSGVDVGATALAVGWELLGSIAFGIAIGMLLGLFLRTVKKGAPLFALMVCVVVAEIGRQIHLDPLIVMLASGIWLENFSRADASDLVHDFETAQLPVFLVWFALAGMRLDIFQLWALIIPVSIIVVVRAGWFFVGMRIASAYTQADPTTAAWGWIGLVPQAGLSLALVVVIQSTFPTFGTFAAVLLLSVLGVNQLVSPVLLRLALVRAGEVGKKRTSDFAERTRAATPPPGSMPHLDGPR